MVPHVVDQSEHLRRHFEDQRALLQIQPEPGVGRVVVGRQLDGAGVHQLLPDRHGLVHRSHRQNCGPVRQLIDRRQAEQIRLHGALEVEVVVELVGGGLIRDAAVEFSVPKRVSTWSGKATPGGIGVEYLYCGLAGGPVRGCAIACVATSIAAVHKAGVIKGLNTGCFIFLDLKISS